MDTVKVNTIFKNKFFLMEKRERDTIFFEHILWKTCNFKVLLCFSEMYVNLLYKLNKPLSFTT